MVDQFIDGVAGCLLVGGPKCDLTLAMLGVMVMLAERYGEKIVRALTHASTAPQANMRNLDRCAIAARYRAIVIAHEIAMRGAAPAG